MKPTVDDLFNEIKLGRGLWIGLFPEPPRDELLHNCLKIVEPAEHFSEYVKHDDLHVTLAHLGRGVSLKFAFDAHAAMEMAASTIYGIRSVLMTGVLRLKKHVAIALVPDEVIWIRSRLLDALRDRKISPDDRFSMTPHLTVAKIRNEQDSPRLPSISERRLNFAGMTMVSGDVRLVAPFSDEKVF